MSDTTSHTTHDHNAEALAAATAAAAMASTQSSSTHEHGAGAGAYGGTSTGAPRTADTGLSSTEPSSGAGLFSARPSEKRNESFSGHVPGGFPSPTPEESRTFLFYRDELVPVPGVEAPILHPGHHAAHDQRPLTDVGDSAHPSTGHHSSGIVSPTTTTTTLPGQHSGTIGSESPKTTAGPHSSDLLNKLDPRIDSDRDGSKTVGAAPSSQHESRDIANAPLTSGTSTGVPSGQHELRHTGSLEQPTSKSTDADDHHHLGRDAALAGGVGAGAAGLGYAASQSHDTSDVGRDNLPQGSSHLDHGSSPYSNKGLDPRVLGSKTNTGEQRFDPHARTDHSAHPAGASSSGTGSENLVGPVHKSSLLNKLDPRVKEKDTTTGTSSVPSSGKHDDPQHHYGRDAALVGAGAGTAAGVHHELQRDNTPSTGATALPPQDSLSQQHSTQHSVSQRPASSSAPLSSSTSDAHHHNSQKDGPGYEPYQGPLTTSGTPFYGAAGAPAPIVDEKASHSHQSTSSSAQNEPGHQHHYGRDAGLAGAGAAAAGGLAYESQRDHHDADRQVTHHQAGPTAEDPASKTVGKHSSNLMNVLDPTVLPDPSKQKDHTTTGPHKSDTLNRMDPKVDEKAGQKDHHYGRDAAIVGGVGAAGYGAHEAADAYGQHRMTQPGASMNEQRYAPSSTGALSSDPVHSGQYDSSNDHTVRDVALGTGLGAGALGGAAYAGSRHADNTQHITPTSGQPYSSSTQPAPVTASYPETGTLAPQNTQSTVPGTTHDRYQSTHDPRDTDHTKRDAALLGTAGVAAGGAAYAHNQKDDERERARAEKEQEKIIHKHEKEVAAHEKEQHKHDIAEQNRLEKERVKEAAKLDKERNKHAEATPEKKHGFLSNLLHRDKSKKEKRSSIDSSPRQSTDARGSYENPRHSKEYAGLGAATTAAAYAEHDHDRNRLHKDPPPGHPAREALESQHEMGDLSNKRAHIGTDGPLGGPHAYDDQS
jgi:hypothetical protein